MISELEENKGAIRVIQRLPVSFHQLCVRMKLQAINGREQSPISITNWNVIVLEVS